MHARSEEVHRGDQEPGACGPPHRPGLYEYTSREWSSTREWTKVEPQACGRSREVSERPWGIDRAERLTIDSALVYEYSLRELCAELGITEKFIKPCRPWQNGRVE